MKRLRTPSLFESETEPSARPEPGPPERPPEGAYCQVAVDRPVEVEFTYSVPAALEARVRPGVRVAVPFGSRREVGVVVGLSRDGAAGGARVRPIAKVLDDRLPIGPELLELTHWIARTYACSWGEALHGVLPAALKRERGSAMVLSAAVCPGVGPAELGALEERHPEQHRLLRTLLEVGAPMELRELRRRLNLSDAPARTLARKNWITLERVPAPTDELSGSTTARPRPALLLPAQASAVERLVEAMEARRPGTFLMQGVTGSGKTEVYLAAIERALELGRGAIVLVPEIALTPQTVGWFRSRFRDVAVLHSRMTDNQRSRTWARLASGECRVVVGARSAIFAPVVDLGVVVVDEEHEPSFKQASTPRYHARDVAIERARAARAVCILGSATPSLESWQAAREGRFERLLLPERVSGHGFPPIEVVDMRVEPFRNSSPSRSRLFSRPLLERLSATLERGEQAILFQNRRGFAPVLWCSGCKQTVRCRQCDVGLTWHRRISKLVCHTCCEERARPEACPTCTKPGLRYLGAGSERIEQELGLVVPEARVRRMDSDTMRRREDYEEVLEAFGAGRIDVLVGTQMIAKGLDFPRVTLVGIVDADAALHLPDFRAAERTFQLIAQVSGRAGRGDLAGRIVVQTHTPEHPAIARAALHDFEGFAAVESELRAELAYPPHGRLIRVLFEDEELERVSEAAERFAAALRAPELLARRVQVLGPAPAPIALARGRHRHHLLVKAPHETGQAGDDGGGLELARQRLRALALETKRPRPTVDVDPVGLL